jgi:hypothetical protein
MSQIEGPGVVIEHVFDVLSRVAARYAASFMLRNPAIAMVERTPSTRTTTITSTSVKAFLIISPFLAALPLP